MSVSQWKISKAVCVLAVLLAALPAAARDGKGTLNLTLENDLWGAGTDEHYTHGTEISYTSDTYQPAALMKLFSWLPFYEPAADTRFTWSLGQQIYTPSDIEETELIVDDRPYAGWLYFSLGLLTDNREGRVRHVDKLELVLGLVGPDARGEESQRAIHKITDSDLPQGWDNQLDNEGTVDLAYQRQWMLPLIEDHIDLVPVARFNLGTSMRYVGTGITLRIGSGLGSDYGPPLIRPSSTGSHYFQPSQRFFWYLFAGVHGNYVDHNIFLDGNDDGNSHSVDKKEWVGNAQVGAVAGFGNWRLALTNIFRTREFHGQPESDEFGSISISYRY